MTAIAVDFWLCLIKPDGGKPISSLTNSLPHWMGGSDGPKNIWFEPHAGKFGSRTKDKVELLLWRRVCVDKTMTLNQAKTAYLKGWTKLLPKK